MLFTLKMWWSAEGKCAYPAVDLTENLLGEMPDKCIQQSLQTKSGGIGHSKGSLTQILDYISTMARLEEM